MPEPVPTAGAVQTDLWLWPVAELRELRDAWPTRTAEQWAAYFRVEVVHLKRIAVSLGVLIESEDEICGWPHAHFDR